MRKPPGLTAWLAKDTDFTRWVVLNYDKVIAVFMIAIAVVLLYRRITAIGKISTVLWVIVLGTILWLIYGGATHFNASNLLSYPSGAWSFSWIFFAGLGHASVQTIYSYLGYYNVCNLGGEMKDPGKNIPRAIFISIFGIAILYFLMQTSILSVVPWQEAARSSFVVSLFVERTFGMHWARLATALILVLAFGSVILATLGYRTEPFTVEREVKFFFALFSGIRAILAMRCLIQLVGQAVGLLLLHRRWKAEHWPFRMWLYPVPVVLAIAGWIAVFISTGRTPMLASLVAMVAGILVYLGRARMLRQWPFEEAGT